MTVTPREDNGPLPPAARIRAPTGQLARTRLLLPIAGVVVGAVLLAVALPGTLRGRVFGFLGIYLIPGGIDYGPLVGISLLDLEPLWILGLITYFDIWITMFWVGNLDHLVRFQWVRDRVEKSRVRAHQLWEKMPWLRVGSGIGLALFIMLPIPYTGSFVGIAIGKLIELRDRAIFIASVSGTFVRVAALAYGSEWALGWF